MFKRLKNLWRLSDNQEVVDRLNRQLQENAALVNQPPFVSGDGKAQVLTGFDEEELAQYKHEQEQGWKHFYRKLRKLI
jgi:hypothetical protein